MTLAFEVATPRLSVRAVRESAGSLVRWRLLRLEVDQKLMEQGNGDVPSDIQVSKVPAIILATISGRTAFTLCFD